MRIRNSEARSRRGVVSLRKAGWLRRGVLAFSLLAVAGELISAFAGTGGGIGVSLRVVDEVAPAGGLALVRVELTEPKPISGGKIRVSVGRAVALARRAAAAAGPLGVIQAVGILSRSGDVQGTATLGETATTIDFTSPRSTYGTDLDLPLIVIAVPVSAAATLGQTANLSVDLSGTQFLDPGGQPYPVEVKQGTFGVGGVSVSRLVAPSDNPAPGTTIILEGVGFQAGARVAIEGADLSSRVVSPQRIEVTTGAQVSLADVAIRLRNPDGSDDMFYAIKELRDTSQGTAATLRFATEAPARIAGTAEDVVLSLPQAASRAGTASISSSNIGVLSAPASVAVAAGASSVRFRVFALAPGSSVLSASYSGNTGTMKVDVAAGSVFEVPILKGDSTWQVGLALTNAGRSAVGVRLRGFSAAQSNPAEPAAAAVERFVSLGPQAQTARFLEEYDPRFAGFQGWVEVSSPSRDVHTMFLNAPAQPISYAGASDPVDPAVEYVFPQSAINPTGNFAFALVNNTEGENSVTLEWRSEGSALTRTRTLPAQGHLATDVATEFGVTEQLASGYLRVQSARPLGAYQQQVSGKYVFGQVPPAGREFSRRLILPQFVVGGGWLTEITLVNPQDIQTEAVLTLFGDDGRPVAAGISSNGVRVTLPVRGQVILQGGDVFGVFGPGPTVGSVVIDAQLGIAGSAVIADATGLEFGTQLPLKGQMATEAIFAQVANGDIGGIGYFTGLAFQNPQTGPAAIQIDVYSAQGQLTGRGSVNLPPGGRTARLLSELVPGLGSQAGGHVHVTSSVPVFMLETFGDDRLSFLTTVTVSVIR